MLSEEAPTLSHRRLSALIGGLPGRASLSLDYVQALALSFFSPPTDPNFSYSFTAIPAQPMNDAGYVLCSGVRYGLPTGQRTARAACLILSTSTSFIFPGLRVGKHMKYFHVSGTSPVSICNFQVSLLQYHSFGNLYPA